MMKLFLLFFLLNYYYFKRNSISFFQKFTGIIFSFIYLVEYIFIFIFKNRLTYYFFLYKYIFKEYLINIKVKKHIYQKPKVKSKPVGYFKEIGDYILKKKKYYIDKFYYIYYYRRKYWIIASAKSENFIYDMRQNYYYIKYWYFISPLNYYRSFKEAILLNIFHYLVFMCNFEILIYIKNKKKNIIFLFFAIRFTYYYSKMSLFYKLYIMKIYIYRFLLYIKNKLNYILINVILKKW